jgi:hypothetical protein
MRIGYTIYMIQLQDLPAIACGFEFGAILDSTYAEA